MSITVPVSGILQSPTSLLLANTSVNDVYSMDAGRAEVVTVVGVVVVNRDASARLVTIWWADGATDNAIFEQSVPANSTVIAIDVPLRLFAKTTAQKIKAQAAAGNVVSVTVSTVMASQSEGVAR